VKPGERIAVGQVVLVLDTVETAVEMPPAGTDGSVRAPAADAGLDASAPRAPQGRACGRRGRPASHGARGRHVGRGAARWAREFRLPELGENVPGGDVLHVLVRPGDVVVRDQPVIELETDKATIEVPSAVAGRVTEVRVKEGDAIKVGDVVFVAEAAGGGPARPAPIKVQRVNVEPAARPPAPAVPSEDKPGMLADAIEEARAEVATATGRAAVVDISRAARPGGAQPSARLPAPAAPSVRRAARELGVDIGQVPGTGPGGRISVDDVKAHVKQVMSSGDPCGNPPAVPATAPAPLPDFTRWGEVERVPMRACGARRPST